MSSSGFRGRGFGLRGSWSIGPTNGFNGPRFPHPGFNHPRPPHRLPGPEKWIEHPKFMSWQQNKNFRPHSQYRGNIQFRPHNRGRAISGRGIVRFSGPGRPSAPQFCMGFIRNPVSRIPLLQEEQVEDKSITVTPIPLLGSEEERQQKITETVDKLKQKLSSITEEDLTNFWEDDLSILPNNGLEDDIQNKVIPELRHEPPELDLTFTDFKDIGRVDCNNSKLDSIDETFNTDEISITFEEKTKIINTNDDIIIVDENKEESSNTLNFIQNKNVLDQSNVLKNNEYHKKILHDLPDPECNLENSNLQCNNVTKDLIFLNSNDTNEKSSNLKENLINSTSIKLISGLITEKSSNLSNVETPSESETPLSNQGALKVDLSQNQNAVEIDTKNTDKHNVQDTVIHQIDTAEIQLVKNDHIPNNVQINISHTETCQNLVNISDSSQKGLFNIISPTEDINLNIACDSNSSVSQNFSEVNISNDDKKSNNPPIFQPRVFSVPPRFTPRIQGPRCRWLSQQNGKNLFPHVSQRLSFHGNHVTPPRNVTSYKPNDLVSVAYDPRARPPFTSHTSVSNNNSQHNALASFLSKDFPPAFDPSEPPPNIRSKAAIESSNTQENMQVIPSVDSRNQTVNIPLSINAIQPHPTFDSRGPHLRIPNITTNDKLPEFNSQQLPPKVHKRDETLQPPPIFDPRLSSKERSNLIAPLDSSRSNMINLMETPSVSEFNMASNFPRPPLVNIPSHQTYISTVQTNFQPILPQTNNGQMMMTEFTLLSSSINITSVPLPPPKESPVELNSNPSQSTSMDDGLEDMQEAMEFAKQIMNMTEEVENENVSLTPSEIPIPNEDTSHSSVTDEVHSNLLQKQKRKEIGNKKCKQGTGCGSKLICEKPEDIEENKKGQNQNKNIEETLLTQDQVRPKVVFNLNSKVKKIHKSEEWHRTPTSNQGNKDTCEQDSTQNYDKEKMKFKKYPDNKRNNTNQDMQNETDIQTNSGFQVQNTNVCVHEQLNNIYQDHTKSLEKSHLHSSNTVISNNMNMQKNQKSRKEPKKIEASTPESMWKNRVISRFLKMSKNDICNMVNNSSLRKFDIAMKHLVKEKRPSLSLEMRNTEDEKMKEYDREEFMSQLNAMLDSGAVVGITDLPTEFIHHLSEVLQLDPMPFDLECSESQSTDANKTPNSDQNDVSKIDTLKCLNKETKIQQLTNTPRYENIYMECGENNSSYNEGESSSLSLSQDNINLPKKTLINKLNSETKNTYKKQQPLFNEADLDDILSEVTDKTKQITRQSMIQSNNEICKSSLLMQTVTQPLECNTFLQIPNKTAADLDDIFSAGIARVKSHNKNADLDNSRTRKCSSEDRGTFRSERYERWYRKEQEDPDTFRNLTKEEWEAKYGSTNTTTSLTVTRLSASSSAENLRIEETRNKEIKSCRMQRYCSSDSMMRHLSLSPSTLEVSISNLDVCMNESEETRRIDQSGSSSSASMSSSSDSDEETVAPDVTKLLKVIKEKEKIAKKRSLNETIRDEVAAEIEKKWKEKSKYKERKSRKREKRKKDRKEKRKKEKKKRRNRNSHSDTSRSSEQMEEFRLLTENEIKKEVIVKEELVSTVQENVPLNNEISNFSVVPNSVNKPAEVISQIESQNLQLEKQQFSRVTCDITSSQIRNKPTVVSITVQPKTKAQLKQMPELSNTQEKEIIEKTVAFAKNNVVNADSKKMKDPTEKIKHNETVEDSDERTDSVSSMNNSFHHINVSVNITEPSLFIQPQIEAASNNNEMNTKLHMCNSSDSINEINESNQCTDQKIVATVATLTESKSGYKKIDIKAYKERTLQRRLKEQAMAKENSESSISYSKNLNHVSSINDTNTASLNITKEINTINDNVSKELLNDPRLDKNKSVSIPGAKQETNSGEKCQNIHSFQNNKESSISVQLKNVNESGSNVKTKDSTELIDSELTALNNFDKMHKNNLKTFSDNMIVVRELDNECKKLKMLPCTVESTKFKNIRSEGSKELKLKKEKIKKSTEKKKLLLMTGKQADKQEIEGIQPSSVINTSSTNQTKIKKTNSCRKRVSLSEPQITHSETFSNTELIINNERKHREISTCSMTEETAHVLCTNNDITNQVNANVLDQQIIDKKSIEIQSLINLKNKKNGIKNTEKSVIIDAYPAEIETSTTPTMQNNIISNIQDIQTSKVVNESNFINLKVKVNNLKNQDNNDPMLHLQDIHNSSDYNKNLDAKSPNSPKSPFKGFLIESIKETVHQISQVDIENGKESIKEYPEQCSQPNPTTNDQTTDTEFLRKRKDSNKTLLACNVLEKPQSFSECDIISKIIHDNSTSTDKTEIGMKTLETEDSNVLQEQTQTSEAIIKQNDISLIMNIHSQDTFDEDSEPFIVLDEYIDDADEKSIEKLSAVDLDLEDCIARDADIFTSKHQQEQGSINSVKPSNFNSIDFKDLSEVFDKNNDHEENQNYVIADKEESLLNKRNILSKEFTHEDTIINSTNVVYELNLEITKNSKLITSTVPVIPAVAKQNIETDITNKPKNNSQHSSERFKGIRSRAASTESEALLKLNVPTKTVIRKSLENLSTAGTPLFKTQGEFLKSNRQINNSEQKNKQELNNSLVDKSTSSTSCKIKTPINKEVASTTGEGKSRSVSKSTLSKSNQQKGNETLHKVKNKSKMKHIKQRKRQASEMLIKETVNSNDLEVKHPNTKDTIMARMIEIDVEIHKLMTEKMTLYQMLTNGTKPSENNLHQTNIVNANKEVETSIVRPQTPSVLMSQLIQNLETSPVTNQCAKRSTRAVPMKETLISTCGSDEEGITSISNNKALTSKKRKKHKSEKTTKKLENISDNNISTTDLQETIIERKQSNEAKLAFNQINVEQISVEHDFSHISLNEMKSQEDSNQISMQQINTEDSLNNDKVGDVVDKVSEKSDESRESTIFTNNVILSKIEENCSSKNNENIAETSNVKDLSLNSVITPLDNKILERSSIYSDDSTWDTLLQNSSGHNKKKLNTGLALLEETYRKEIAKRRKTKIDSRKKKKKKIPEIVNTLTPEEEELPLSALCAKKLHKKKKLLNSRDQGPDQTDTDQQLWQNVVEVINAVAKNRTDQLYMKRLERQSSDNTGAIVPGLERNAISNSLEGKENQTVVSSVLKNTEDNVSKNLDKNNLQLSLSFNKLQHCEEPGQQNLEIGVTSKYTSNLSESPISIENSIIKPFIQETVENESTGINQPHLIKDSDACIMKLNTDNTNNNHNTSDISKIDQHEEKVDKIKKINVQKKDINIKKNLIKDEPSNTHQRITILQSSKENENLVEFNNCKNLSTHEITNIAKEDSNFTENKNKQNDSSVSHKRHDFTDTSEEFNYVSQNEYFMNLKKQESIQKSKSISEENNNSSTDILKGGETSSKRVAKRKRSSKVPVRRSSRYTEEITKHIKLETDGNSEGIEQELQDKNVQMILPRISDMPLPEKEIENAQLSAKKFKPQKSVFNRKKHRPRPLAVEVPPDQLIPLDESIKQIKNCKQYIASEIKNCEVRLVDCKHTILNPNIRPNVLQKHGISTINSCMYVDSTQTSSDISIVQSTSTKDVLNTACAKRKISITEECPQNQPAKLNRIEETQPLNNEINVADIENDNEEYTNPHIDVMPILTKEPVIINVSENCDKPDIEIVEEKTTSTISQQYSNSESTLTVIDTNDDKELPRIQYTVHKGPILDIKVFENSFLAASEDGRVYRYNQASNGILNIYKGHTAAVTCLYVYNTTGADISKEWIFSGSLDGTLRCYNITTGVQVRDTADVGSPIQCMDEAWGIIFIGTKSGHVSRYHMKSGVIKGNSIQFSDKSVLALKATNEGPRKVLIVASRSQPITIRDAQNGLFLRTICGQKSHTVYSLMRDNNLIYCGTSCTSIPVFDFTNGEQILQYDAGVGIVCMRLYKQLLFAGCYDGNIYVFDTKDHRLICSIPGPGNMLLSMEVIDNKIIAGSKDKRLQSWQMPLQARTLLQVNQL